MSQSSEYFDPAFHDQVDFTDSVVIRPICLKPSVIPSFLNRSNPENTILATYDNIKLTQYIDSTQEGTILQLISLQRNSLNASLTSEGLELLQKFSGQDIAFIIVTGQKGSGKSFFIDKILNLSNVQGNNFSINQSKPGINVWSTPFLKDDFKFFIGEVSNCSPGSKQFSALLPFASFISSIIINFQEIKEKNNESQSIQKLDKNLQYFLRSFYSQERQINNKNEVFNTLFPSLIVKVKRAVEEKDQSQNYLTKSQIRQLQFTLPDAKNNEYRGIDQDLKIHSFLNKKCVSQKFINKVSDLFGKIYTQVQNKKHRQLVFNGGILIKYLKYLAGLFNKKSSINIYEIYYEVVKDLYISAYNYCVICYHESLQQALSDQRPRSLDEVIQIFEISSNKIFEKYNQFTLEKSLHQEYEQKLLNHIESKERLILEINKKKTDLELTKIYQQQIDQNNIKEVWKNISQINYNYPQYTHGKDQTLGRKLNSIIRKLKSGNNVDYKLMKQIQKLKQSIEMRTHELSQIKRSLKLAMEERNQIKRKEDTEVSRLQKEREDVDKKINQIKKQIKLYQNIDIKDPASQKIKQQQLKSRYDKNQKELQRLKQDEEKPLQTRKQIVDMNNKIQNVKNKIQSLQQTLNEVEAAKTKQNGQAEENKIKQMKKKQNTEGDKKIKKQESSAIKKGTNDSKPRRESSNINESGKVMKQSQKVNKK